MVPCPGLPSIADTSQRRRFEALRRRIFDEMGRSAARWRLTWLLPFNALVFGLLVVRGEATWRAIVQLGTVSLLGVLLALRARSKAFRAPALSCALGVLGYFALLATTGGLASPLLVVGGIMLTAAAITLRDPPWMRSFVFYSFLAGFAALALLSVTPLGHAEVPLAPKGGLPSPDYVAIALLATVFTTMGVYRVGCAMTHGYERAALELAERREELCSEGEDRTRSLEGLAVRLAHEVKNPLAAIKGLSTHMARNTSDAKTAERLAIVAAEADRLQSIVDGFLTFSRGLDDLKLAPTRLNDVVRELAVLLETRAQDAGVAIETAGDGDLVVRADVRKVRQALLNIVLNAIQASPSGSTVSISVIREQSDAIITVRDNGVGMTPDVVERIKKPHFTTKEGGTGLGVAVARGLIEQHGGQLDFKSASGKGTAATIRLPVEPSPAAELPNPLRSLNVEPPAGNVAREMSPSVRAIGT